MTNSRINKKKALVSIREMDKKAKSIPEVQRVMSLCHAQGVKYSLLSNMDDDTFSRAISEEHNQVEQFFKR